MSRPLVGPRLQRVLALVPWILAHPGVTLAELATRFEVSERELERDLELLPMCGLPPYTADRLIDVVGDRRWRRDPPRRVLRASAATHARRGPRAARRRTRTARGARLRRRRPARHRAGEARRRARRAGRPRGRRRRQRSARAPPGRSRVATSASRSTTTRSRATR